MKILALEFSSERRSAAVFDSQRPAVLGVAAETGGRSTRAFGLVDSALRASGLEREQIECIAVGLGPGSYTGVRVAIALAQGWGLTSNVLLLGVSSLECLAATAQSAGFIGTIHFAINAQREEFYLATYAMDAAGFRVTEPLHLASKGELRRRHDGGSTIVGPEINLWLPDGHTLFPDAAVMARLAADRTDFIDGSRLEPIYLRETDFVKATLPRAMGLSKD